MPARMVTTWLLLACGLAAGQEKGIHIDEGRSVGFSWYVNDGAGFRWDISSNGQVADGTNDAYDGGMQLRIAGTYFSAGSQGRMSKDGREVEIGPWSHAALRIWRRVYVDDKAGYCRWIDIFENPSGGMQTAAVQYYSNMGGTTNLTYTTGGRSDLTDKDWGIVTGYDATSTGGRPTIAHVFASKGAKLVPKFRWTRGSDDLYQDIELKVPPRKAVALCFFESQQSSYPAAQKFLREFNPKHELGKVPPALRRIILNMGGATLVLGQLDLPRHERHDLAVLRNDNELLGTILNDRFELETFYGKLDLPAGRVVGINVPAGDDPHVQVVLADGQIAAGRLLNAPLRMRLTTGAEMSLPPGQLASATFSLSADRPEEIRFSEPLAVLRSGERLAFRAADLDGAYHTEHGEVKLSGADLRAICLDTPEGGLHRAVFRNGSVLSGLLTAERLKLGLRLGPTLTCPRELVSEFLFPAAEGDGEGAPLAELTCRNDDQLFGRIAEDKLTVTTRYGQVVVQPAELAELQVPDDAALGQVRLKLHNGTTVSGRLVGERVRFQIVPGPTLAVFLGHVVQITCPAPAAAPTTRPAAAAAASDGAGAAAPAETRARSIPEMEKLYMELVTKRRMVSGAVGAASDPKVAAGLREQVEEINRRITEIRAQLKEARTRTAASAPAP